MLSLLTIVVTMYAALALGTRRWHNTARRNFLLILLAVIQTSFLLYEMFIQQPPAF